MPSLNLKLLKKFIHILRNNFFPEEESKNGLPFVTHSELKLKLVVVLLPMLFLFV